MNFYSDNEALKFHLNHPTMRKCVDMKENGYTDKEKYDYAPENFEDAMDSYEKVMEIIGDISANVLDVNAEDVDHEGPEVIDGHVKYARGTQENHDVLTRAGVYGIALPRKYNGLNFSYVPYVMAAEIVSRGDAGFANIWGLQDCAETIYEYASEDIKDEFLPRIHDGKTCSMDLTEPDAGSDLQAVQLKATYDEAKGMWMLNGVKRFITNGDADIKLVLARSEEGTHDGRGLSYFVHDRNWGGVRVRRIENKLGIKGSPTCELVFTNAPAKLVGDRKLGLIKYVMSLMNGARLGVGAQSVGVSEAAYRAALKYAGEREQLTSVESLRNFIDALPPGSHGIRKARAALEHVVDGLASPMEVFLGMSLGLPADLGGRGPFLLHANQVIDIDAHIQRLLGARYLKGDLYLPEFNADVEFDSYRYHTGSYRLDHTQARRNALEAMGIKTISATYGQVKTLELFDEFVWMLRQRLGLDHPAHSYEERQAQMALHNLLLSPDHRLF